MILPHRCIAIFAISLLAASCQKKARPATPVAPVVLPKAEKAEPPPPLPPAPKIEGGKQPIANPPVVVEVKPPPPEKQPPVKKSRRNPPSKKGDVIKAEVRPPEVKIEPKVETPPAKPEAAEPAPAQPAAAGLGEILTPEQVRDYTRRFDAALDRGKNALLIIQSKTLNAAQKQSAERIRGFIVQAEQARPQDLAIATSLAERADLLSKDLLDHLQ